MCSKVDQTPSSKLWRHVGQHCQWITSKCQVWDRNCCGDCKQPQYFTNLLVAFICVLLFNSGWIHMGLCLVYIRGLGFCSTNPIIVILICDWLVIIEQTTLKSLLKPSAVNQPLQPGISCVHYHYQDIFSTHPLENNRSWFNFYFVVVLYIHIYCATFIVNNC